MNSWYFQASLFEILNEGFAWREELADGALATRGLIDVDGLTRIGRDPFLRQQYALDVKNTVTTERWVASWLDAGGLLKE